MGENDLSNATQWAEEDSSLGNSTTTILVTTTPSGILTTTTNLSQMPNEVFYYFQLSSLTLIAVVGFFSNALVLLLFYKRPTLRSFSNRFVLNLSISHFWQCVLVLPTTVISIATDQQLLGDNFCIISGFIFTTLNITSVLSLLLIALDRNCAVNSPLHYSMTITKTRTGFLIFATWFLGFLVACPPLFDKTLIEYRPEWHMCTLTWKKNNSYSVAYGSVLIVLGFMVPLLITICVYSSMFQAAKDNSERARKHSVNSTIVETIPDAQVKIGSSVAKKKCRRWSSGSNQFFGEEWKAVRTGFLVVMTFTFCWMPYFAVMSVETYYNSDFKMPTYLLFIVVFCVFSACVINPYLYVFRNKTSRKNIKQLICPSNLAKNKKWIFQRQTTKDKSNQTAANPCILAASLVNESSEKVKALPALYQDTDGRWQVYSTSEERSREDLDETVSNISDEDFFDTGIQKTIPSYKRKYQAGSINVQAIYNNTYNTRSSLAKNASSVQQPHSNKLLLCRLKTSLNRDSTSSDTTDNCSMSLESNNSNENQLEPYATASSRRGIGKYLFSTSEELYESKPSGTHNKRIGSVAEESASNTNRKTLSSFGKARRKSFIHSHMQNKKSSETALTSSTNSETLESSSAASTRSSKSNRPRLVRQVDTIEPPDDI